MLKFLTFNMLAVALMPATSNAQGVDYRSFVRTHALLAPSSAGHASVAVDSASTDQEADRAPLALDFETMGSDPQLITPAASPLQRADSQRPRISAWMHARGSFAPLPSPHFASAQRPQDWQEIPVNCPHDEYRPKGLKREVEERRARYYTLVITTACRIGVPANLFDALITQESDYNPYALSIKGAIGMAQLMPATARSAGVANPWDLSENLRGAAQILKGHLAEFGRYDLALAAYNAGAGRVRQTRQVPRIRETAAYVSSILNDVRRQYARAIGLSGSPTAAPAPLRTASLVRF